MKTKSIIILIALVFIGLSVHAQTNNVPAAAVPSAQDLAIADAVRTLVLAVLAKFSGVTFSGACGALFAAYLTAKGLRNRTALGAGKLAPLLNLLNLEAKPATSPLPPAPAKSGN